jgi:Co/Zn/Cd efflux system component
MKLLQMVVATIGLAIVVVLVFLVHKIMVEDLGHQILGMETLAVASLFGAFYLGKVVRLKQELFGGIESEQTSVPGPLPLRRASTSNEQEKHNHKWLSLGDVCLVFLVVVLSISVYALAMKWLPDPTRSVAPPSTQSANH